MKEHEMHRKGRLPKHLIEKHVLHWAKDNVSDKKNACVVAGVDESYFRSNTKTMHWMLADRILCRLNMNTVWWTDPELNHHYMRVNMTAPYNEARLGERMPWYKCRLTECDNSVDVRRGYCSEECKAEFGRIEYQRKLRRRAASGDS